MQPEYHMVPSGWGSVMGVPGAGVNPLTIAHMVSEPGNVAQPRRAGRALYVPFGFCAGRKRSSSPVTLV